MSRPPPPVDCVTAQSPDNGKTQISPPPYESAAARRMVLYRIPSVPAAGRIVELHFPGTVPVLGEGWRGAKFETRLIVELSKPDADISLACDMVVLHRTLDDAENCTNGAVVAQAIFTHALELLHSGGIVAGCICNRYALDRESRARGTFSASSFRKIALASGIADLNLYCLYPNPESPTILLDQNPNAYRHFSRRHVTRPRRYISILRHLLKQAWVASALGRMVAPAYFFVGRKI